MNNCDKKQLTLWVAGVLDPEAARGCEEHLAHCEECREDHAVLRAIANDFDSHARILAPVGGVNRLHQSLQRRLHEQAKASNSAFSFPKWTVPIAISTATVVAAFLVWSNGQKNPLAPAAPQLVQSRSATPKTDATPAPTLSSYSSATRKSLDEFDRALDAQVRTFSTHPARNSDSPITLSTLL